MITNPFLRFDTRDWARDALCRRNPSWWDAELDGVQETDSQRSRRHARAKAICRRCPVIDTCFELTSREDTGVRHAVLLGVGHPDEKVPPAARAWRWTA